MTDTPSRRARVALVVVSVAGAALAIELVLRVSLVHLPVPFLIYVNAELKDRAPETWEKARDSNPQFTIRKEDPETGFTYKPNLRLRAVNEDGEPYDVVTSPEGFITPDSPPAATPQLILLGDSFLATFYTRRPLPYVLRARLQMPTYSLAVGGWGPESYVRAYRKFGAGRRHDLVLVFTFLNDITDVANWQTWKGEQSGESFLTWLQRAAASDALNPGTTWFDTHLVLWNLMRFSLRQVASRPDPQSRSIILAGDASRVERISNGGRSFDQQLIRDQVFLQRDPDAFLPGGDYYVSVQAYLESLVRLKAEIEHQHARMVLIWIPTKERVFLPLLPRERRDHYVTNRTRDIAGLEGMLARFAAQEGLSFLDLTPPLVERAKAGEKLYFTNDGHFDSRGQETVGEIVSEFVARLPEHAPAPAPGAAPLYLRHGTVAVERELPSSGMSYHAAIVQQKTTGWAARGRAESRFSYLARWPDTTVDGPRWLLAKGVVRRGGLSLGVLKDEKWDGQLNVTTRGSFDVALPVTRPGRYAVLVANSLPETSLDTDVEIDSMGWAAAK